jgi:hypothetical protein
MELKKFYHQHAFQHFLETDPEILEHAQFETALTIHRSELSKFFLDGYCKVCDQPTTFLVDRLYGAQETAEGWRPNWRERLVCQSCQLNNRQRAMAHQLKAAIATRLEQQQTGLSLYAMEQISPLFHWLKNHLTAIHCVGSEYLNSELSGGTIVDGIRHEDAESLSFEDQTFDLITSNDVLEHVNAPERAMSEMYRILKPAGEVLITIPFHLFTAKNVRRALLKEGKIEHLLPPSYHGNPISSEGSLVFHDFGWEFVEQLRESGFQEVALCSYWSYLYGYLGDTQQYYFWARK